MQISKRLPIKVSEQMIEFYRRQYVIGDGNYKDLGNLGFPSEMKAVIELGLAKPFSNETPRVLNWYSLTEKGKDVIETYKKLGLSPEKFTNFSVNDYSVYSEIISAKFVI